MPIAAPPAALCGSEQNRHWWIRPAVGMPKARFLRMGCRPQASTVFSGTDMQRRTDVSNRCVFFQGPVDPLLFNTASGINVNKEAGAGIRAPDRFSAGIVNFGEAFSFRIAACSRSPAGNGKMRFSHPVRKGKAMGVPAGGQNFGPHI